jgi:AraC-like DNA-binding protein
MAEAIRLKKTSKHGIIDLLEGELDNYTGELHCALPGIEFLLPPYPVYEIRKSKKSFKVSPQSVLVFNGAELHVEQFVDAKASLKSIVVQPQFITNFCEPLAIKSEEIEFNTCELAKDLQLEQQIRFLAEIANPQVNASEFSMDCLTSEILIGALNKHKNSQSEKFAKESQSGYFPGTIAKIKSVIHQNIENPHFNLDLLAKESGLSKFHLIRVFKKNVGISPAKYLSQVKTDLAKHWLLKSQKSVLSIAMDLGFSDLSTFNKAFKKPWEFLLADSVFNTNFCREVLCRLWCLWHAVNNFSAGNRR